MKTINSITIVFENCEMHTFDSKDIGYFEILGIHSNISRIAANAIEDYESADEIAIELFSEANKEYKPFEHSKAEPIFDRITKWRDITSIVLNYEDGTERSLYVDYTDEVEDQLGTPNVNQSSIISSLGNLYLTISAKNNVEYFFPREEIEDAITMGFYKDMIRL